MATDLLPLVIGLPGPVVDARQLELVERIAPAGVILFERNIETPDQVRDLVEALQQLDQPPFVSIDLEGGVVNRLARLWGPLPTPAEAAAAGRRAVRTLGEAAGAACRALGIHLDLAPVVDLDRPRAAIGGHRRCLGSDPVRVAQLARVFHGGLAAWGVHGCLKHFPGLGPVAEDTHVELPRIDEDEATTPHLQVFRELASEIPIVMVGHVVVPSLGDRDQPASLSRTVVKLAASLPGHPVVLSDDLEMGALAGLGELPALVATAIEARNHGVLVCKAFDRLDEIAGHLAAAAIDDPAFAGCVNGTAARLGTLRGELERRMAAVPAPDFDAVADLWERARRATRSVTR